MIFTPQKYNTEDTPNFPFIDRREIFSYLEMSVEPDISEVRRVIARSLSGERLSMGDAALLMRASSSGSVSEILSAAAELKKRIYGNRIVLFAPLYIGNRCVNNCSYCGFRASNTLAVRRTLSDEDLTSELAALENDGHKRLILVYGEHPHYDARYIAHTVKLAYAVRENGQIRRVNVNAAPLDVEGFRTVKDAGIGTYQIFQETYDEDIYRRVHPSGPKSDYAYRLTAMDRAMEAGVDDVGLGVLLGLGDWRFELLALIRHTNHLEACFGVGPHTISFPRIKNASSLDKSAVTEVSDEDFVRIIAILRLAVPYTGLILTARETPELRDRLIEFGVSQIDAGTRLELGGYSSRSDEQDIHREQFELGDDRSLSEMIDSLVSSGQIPSFCTACYRKGRTGEHFMEFSTKGFIKRFCTPNALLTFAEYLEQYASPESKAKGWAMIEKELHNLPESGDVESRLDEIRRGGRDLLY